MTLLFKKGDLIKATADDGGGSFTSGKLYTVRKDHDGSDAYVLVEQDDRGSGTNGWNKNCFELVTPETPKNVLGTQVGGSHYTDCAIQPIEYIWANGLGFSEGNIIKYVTRWRTKGGIKDLEKAKHHIALLIEHETLKQAEYAALHGH